MSDISVPTAAETQTDSAASDRIDSSNDDLETTDPPHSPEIDLDAMTADLDGVDAALARLADGTYWTDEVTGEPIPAAVLDADPIARRG